MSGFSKIGVFFKAMLNGKTPEVHKHYENNFDFKEYYENIDKLIRENQDLTKERDDLLIKLKQAVKRNTQVQERLDKLCTVIELMLASSDLPQHKKDHIQHLLDE